MTKERKTSGATAGFVGKDVTGLTFLFKLHHPHYPELGAGAETIDLRILWVLRYYVPLGGVCVRVELAAVADFGILVPALGTVAGGKGRLFMKGRKLKVAVIGTGNIGQAFHIPGWQAIPDVEVVAAADISKKALGRAVERFGIPQASTDYRRIVRLKEVDVVDVCTPNKAHPPVVLASLTAGKHVLCEKPLATTPAEVERMIRAARAARRKLMTAQTQRFRPESVALKAFVESGALGRRYYGRCWAIRRNLLPTAPGFIVKKLAGGGPCMDIGVHILDLGLWLLDFPRPESVVGVAQANIAHTKHMPGGWGEWDRKQFDVEDFAAGFVRFKDGSSLTLESSWLGHVAQAEELRCTILGTKAGVSWPGGEVWTAQNGLLVDAKLTPKSTGRGAHENQIRAFYDCVADGKPSPVPPEQSLDVIKILDGIYRSQRTRREVRL